MARSVADFFGIDTLIFPVFRVKMACAPEHQHSHKEPGTEGVSSEDEKILREPYSVAVQLMGYTRTDLIVLAVKKLLKDKKRIQGGTLMLKVEDLERYERQGYESDSDSSYVMDSSSEEDEDEDEEDDIQADNENLDLQSEDREMHPAPAMEKLDSQKVTPKKADVQPQASEMIVLCSENKRLKDRQLCKKCRDRTVSVTFLPCGHFSYCYECGQGYSACPICRKTILADVKTFMS